MSDSPFQRLLRELRKRKVFRVAGVYVLVGWLVLQVGDVVVEPLRLPEWTMTLLIVLVALGLPVALVLAWVFDLTSEGLERTDDVEPGTTSFSEPRWVAMALVFLVVVSGAWYLVGRERGRGPEIALDDGTIAVMPFRTAGAASELAYLREGMLDLMATKLTGEGGPRAVDPRTLMSAWRATVDAETTDLPPEEARALARRLGAGRVLLGEVVSAPGRVVLSASILDTETGRASGPVSVEGRSDSVTALVDELAAGLLSVEAGENERRLAQLTSTSLPALRAYLQGQAASRRGRYREARRHYETALELDPTFALAGIRLNMAAGWIGGLDHVERQALEVAWHARHRLGPGDRALLDAEVGPRYPLAFSRAEALVGWERAVEAVPDRAEAWQLYGDQFFHFGRILEVPDAERRAAAAMARSLELDSALVGSLMHLIQLAAHDGDTARVRDLAARYLTRDTAGEGAQFVRWRAAASLGDSATLNAMARRLDALSPGTLFWITIAAQEEGFGIETAQRAARVDYQRAGLRRERERAGLVLCRTLLNRGRPAEALEVSESLMDVMDPALVLSTRVIDGLYGHGDSAAADAAARELTRSRAPDLADSTEDRLMQYATACALGQWHLWREEIQAALPHIERLTDARSLHNPEVRVPEAAACLTLLRAIRAAVEERPDAARRVAEADSMMHTYPPFLLSPYHAAVVRLQDRYGSTERALAAARSRVRWSPRTLHQLGALLEEEGRLAAELGRQEEAIRAYRHYLTLRADPEPAVAGRVEAVRRALESLIAER